MFTGMLLSAACATGPEAGRSGAPVVPSDNTPTQQGPPSKYPDTTWCEGAWLTDNRCIV